MPIARPAMIALAMLIASPAAPAQQVEDKAEQVDVLLSNFKFEPSTIQLRAGHSYVLHLVNGARGAHDFEAKTFFAAAQVDPGDRMKIPGGRIELRGGESVDIHLVAPGPGNFPVRCTHFMHSGFGMTGRIVVG